MKIAGRHRIVAMCALAVVISYFDRVNMSVAVVSLQQALGWSEITKGMVLSSFFLGYIVFQLLGALLCRRYGARLTLGLAVLTWSVVTLLTPAAISLSVACLIATRILLGMGEAIVFPASLALFRSWVPPTELSRAVAVLTSAVPLGTVVGLTSTGWMIQNLGWTSAFYVFGFIGVIWALVWLATAKDLPGKKSYRAANARASGEKAGSADLPDTVSRRVPWRLLLSSKTLWVLVFNHFASNWTLYLLLSWLPSYFRTVHALNLGSSSLYSAIPWLVMFISTIASGWLADKLINSCVPRLTVRKFMQCAGLIGAALPLWFLRDVGSADSALILLSTALAFIALTWAGYAPCYLENSPKHAEVTLGIGNTFAALPGVVGVFLAGFMINVSGSYDSVFLLTSMINLIAATAWLFIWSDKPMDD